MTYRFNRPKYHAVPTKLDGFTFASKAEAEYYAHLCLLRKAGEVLHVDVHPVFTLGPGDKVRLDFLVWYPDGTVEGIDVKGARRTKAASEFRRMARRWNHPAVTLKAVCRKGKAWGNWMAP